MCRFKMERLAIVEAGGNGGSGNNGGAGASSGGAVDGGCDLARWDRED